MAGIPVASWARGRWAPVQLAGAVLALAGVAAALVPPDIGPAWFAEDAPVETVQAIAWFAMAAGLWRFRHLGERVSTPCALSIVLLAMGARELEWHKAWTQGNMLKASFYFGPASPIAKLVGAAVVIVVAIAVMHLLNRHARRIWRGLRHGEPLSVTVATFFAALLFARLVDKSLPLLEHFGHDASASTLAAKMIVEETIELLLPLLVLLGAFQRDAVPTTPGAVHRSPRPHRPARARTRGRTERRPDSGSCAP